MIIERADNAINHCGDVRGAHELIDSSTHFGKIVLTTGADLAG
ncbi:hypothetical protein [Pseudomonas fluorescens]